MIPATPTVQTAYQRQGAFQSAQRKNHRLKLSSAVLSPAQVAALETALTVAYQRLLVDKQRPHQSLPPCVLSGGLILRLMIDLGRDVAEIAGFAHTWVVPKSRNMPSRWGLSSWIAGPLIGRCWVLRPGVGNQNQRTQIRAIQRVCLPRTERWLDLAGLLPDRSSVPPLSPQHPSGPPVPMFSVSVQQLELDVDCFLKWARKILGPRGRLLNNLPSPASIIAEDIRWAENGDRALADIMTGTDGEDAKQDYTYPGEEVLDAQDEALAQRAGQTQPTVEGKPEINATRATSTRAVDPQVFRTAFASVDWNIDRRRDIVTEHERLTILLWLTLSISIASRARIYPLPSLQLVDPRTGAFLVLDKATRKIKPQLSDDTAAFPANALGDARIVFLPAALRRRIEAYRQHLRMLSARRDIRIDARLRISSLADRFDAGKLIWFFALRRLGQGKNAKIIMEPLRPKAVAYRVEKHLKLRLETNFARHMLRSGLVGRVSHEVIDALLGHWDQGTEPWATGSALDPMAVRAMMTAIGRAFVPMDPST